MANFSSINATLSEAVWGYVRRFIGPSIPSESLHVRMARHYDLIGSVNYKQPLGLQTGLYDFDT